nr:rhamnogalacturonan lyase [uncultured Butyrivibrio sp.]
MELRIDEITDQEIKVSWDAVEGATNYRLLWKDRNRESMQKKALASTTELRMTFKKMPRIPYYLTVQALSDDGVLDESKELKTPITTVLHEQLEKINRGLVAVASSKGIFVSWRLFKNEVKKSTKTGLTGTDFALFKNGKLLTYVTDSTNYLDANGTMDDRYSVIPYESGKLPEMEELQKALACAQEVQAWKSGRNYLDIPLKIPEGGTTPAGEAYVYHANDISIGDVDGDGEYEYIVKWDPSNSKDVSQKGYTGKVYLDCYKLDGRLLWRLDMGVNIRAGAHYTQFMVYDFNGDGIAEMAVKTAPGTCMHIFDEEGKEYAQHYITIPESDVQNGVTNEDNYVSSAGDYAKHLKDVFRNWHNHPEVVNGHWPATLEECFEIPPKYTYPLSETDAEQLTDYFIKVYAPGRSARNKLDEFEGFIFNGPEYLTMFGGDGRELETIPFKFGRDDDGLMWGDYAMARIEPCNRVDRFLSGVAYLDGERPYLIVCRGYYTRTTLVAYDFFENRFREKWSVDSGYVQMENPFCDNPHELKGSDPVYGVIAGQGNHSLSTADVDGDGYQEIIYGAACIDHDGSVLYSSYDYLPNGTYAKLGHGDAMHVANIDPDRPGLEIFNVFEGAKAAPYGYALRDAETGKVYFGEYAESDLGRCMIGDIAPEVPGLQVWVNDVYSVKGDKLDIPAPSTNMNIHWAADLTTQVTDGKEYLIEEKCGIINDITHGVMLRPEGTATNNGTKGNPCLVADLFGDFRDEIVLRLSDDSALRIYINTDITEHKLFTPLQDIQYRMGVCWQNNCYNQPGYVSYYYASDMNFDEVLPELKNLF